MFAVAVLSTACTQIVYLNFDMTILFYFLYKQTLKHKTWFAIANHTVQMQLGTCSTKQYFLFPSRINKVI